MKKLIIFVTLTVSLFVAQPVLADGPRLMRDDAPSFAPAVELKQVYHIEQHRKQATSNTGLIPPVSRIAPPVRAHCPEVWMQ